MAKRSTSVRQPLLSVVIITYNRADMLARCLASTCATTVQDCEIVVIDDASTDGTNELVTSWKQRDKRVRHVRNPVNLGPAKQERRILEEARGKYVALLGDDDSPLPGNYELKIAILEDHPEVGFVYSLWNFVEEEGRMLGISKWPGLTDYSYIGSRNEFLDLFQANYLKGVAFVFRRELAEKYGWFDLRPDVQLANDWDLWLRWCRQARTAFIAEPLVNVGMHTRSITNTLSQEGTTITGRMAVWRKYLVEDEDPPVLDEWRWNQMLTALRGEIGARFGSDAEQAQRHLADFQQLKCEHTARVQARFYRLAGKPVGSPAPVDGTPAVWTGAVEDASSYASELRSFAQALTAAGTPPRLEEVRWSTANKDLPAADAALLQALKNSPLPEPGSYVRVRHTEPIFFWPDPLARAVVGRTMFWTDRLPPRWAERCNLADAVWVPSDFQREAFLRGGVDEAKLRVLPGCIDVQRFGPQLAPADLGTGRGFNFLSMGEWSLRKGWDMLVSAFAQEFAATEDVALVLMLRATAQADTATIQRDIQQLIGSAVGQKAVCPIRVTVGLQPHEWLPSIYRGAQAYVQPSRGSAGGRCLLEAMASGLPTIATAWGSNLEWMDDSNSFLVRAEEVDVPAGILPDYFGPGHRCGAPSVEHLRQLMRAAVTDPGSAATRAAQAHEVVTRRFSISAVAPVLRDLLAEAAAA